MIGALTLTAVSIIPAHGADAPALAELLNRAGVYVRRFEQDFALIVSDEDYRQRVSGKGYATPLNRRTRAEMLFMWMPDERAWLTVRNVVSVDGRPRPDNQRRLNEMLTASTADRVARMRALLNESARFNLGRIFRNFNYPTETLAYLDPLLQPRFAFTLEGRERIDGMDAWKIQFDEQQRPTIIQESGADRFSRGAVWVAGGDGAVLRTRLELRIPLRDTVASVEVDHRRDARLDMFVPVRMHESYLQSRASMLYESIDSVATYSNFRRFETSGRIIEPK